MTFTDMLGAISRSLFDQYSFLVNILNDYYERFHSTIHLTNLYIIVLFPLRFHLLPKHDIPEKWMPTGSGVRLS